MNKFEKFKRKIERERGVRRVVKLTHLNTLAIQAKAKPNEEEQEENHANKETP